MSVCVRALGKQLLFSLQMLNQMMTVVSVMVLAPTLSYLLLRTAQHYLTIPPSWKCQIKIQPPCLIIYYIHNFPPKR